MGGFTAMRRPFPRAAAILVPVVGALLAAAAIGATLGLQAREARDRDRQFAILSVRSDLREIEGIPWRSPAVSDYLPLAERDLVLEVRRLHLDALLPLLNVEYAALAAADESIAAGRTAQAATLIQRSDEIRRALEGDLIVAAERASHSAELADDEATAGSATVIVLLVAAFLFLHRRLGRAHERLQRAQADRVRLLAKTVEGAERERRRIAADLHDGPIQRLTATAFALDLLANRIRRGELESVSGGLSEVREALAAQMECLRRLMAELRPPVLDEGGVAAAIASQAALVLSPSATCAVRDRTGAARLTPELETAVYRFTCEALANVAKHARATRVDVLLERRGRELHVAVSDDGVGFDAHGHDTPATHLGLSGMRERVEGVGGHMALCSSPGRGTRVEATLPWRPRVEETRAAA